MSNPKQFIRVGWTDEQHLGVVFTFSPGFNWADFAQTQAEVNTMIAHTPHNVDLIYDMSNVGNLPAGNADQLPRIVMTYPLNIGMVMWAGCNAGIETAIRDVTRYSKDMAWLFAFVDTPEEALACVGP